MSRDEIRRSGDIEIPSHVMPIMNNVMMVDG